MHGMTEKGVHEPPKVHVLLSQAARDHVLLILCRLNCPTAGISLCLTFQLSFDLVSPRGSHIDVACRSVCDRYQNGIKRSMFLLGADQGTILSD